MRAHDIVRMLADKSYIVGGRYTSTKPPFWPSLIKKNARSTRRWLPSISHILLVFKAGPVEAASIVLGFDVAQFMLTAPSTQPIEWIGNMAYLYNP
jgi:hypothetical protein